jgi:hypothetical protein
MNEIEDVDALCKKLGYGHLMNLVSALWRKNLAERGHPVSYAFISACGYSVKKNILKQIIPELESYDNIIKNKQ